VFVLELRCGSSLSERSCCGGEVSTGREKRRNGDEMKEIMGLAAIAATCAVGRE
jgi:hypothetical protein